MKPPNIISSIVLYMIFIEIVYLIASVPVAPATLNILLHGHENSTTETNEAIYKSVLPFIKRA